MAPFQRDEFQSVSSSSSTTSLNGVNAWFTWKSAISSRGIKGRRRRYAYLFDPRNTDFFPAKNIKERSMKLHTPRTPPFESMPISQPSFSFQDHGSCCKEQYIKIIGK